MVAIYARYEGPAPRQDARPVRRRDGGGRPAPRRRRRAARDGARKRRRVGVARDRRRDPRLDGRARRRPARGRRPRALRPAHRPPAPDPGGGRWLDAACRDGPDAGRKPGPCDRRGRRCADALAADRPVDRPQAPARPALGCRVVTTRRPRLRPGHRPAGRHGARAAPGDGDEAAGRPGRGMGGARTRPAARRTPGARPRRHRRPLGRAGAAAAHRRAVRPAPIGVDRDRGGRPRRAGRLAARGSHRAEPHARPRSARRRAVRLAGIAALAGPRCLPRLRGRGAVGRGPGAGRALRRPPTGGARGPRPAAGAPGPRAAGAQRRAASSTRPAGGCRPRAPPPASWPCCTAPGTTPATTRCSIG